MNCWETFYMQLFHQHSTLINEKTVSDFNPLYEIADRLRHKSPYTLHSSVTHYMARSTHITAW